MERKLWHECPKCGSVYDGDTPYCSACGTNNPGSLYLTRKEVVERVWPDLLKIWTKQPSLFFQPLAEKRQELLVALLVILKGRIRLLEREESHAREAVLA